MAVINPINNQTSELTVDPRAASDSFIQFDIATVNKFRIGIDDTNDAFKVSQGNALGTNDTFIMTAAGERTMPLQPAFLVYLSSNTGSVTGTGEKYTLIFDTEVYDQNNDYNNVTGIFEAPVTGVYMFNVICDMGKPTYGAHLLYIEASNRNVLLANGGNYFFQWNSRYRPSRNCYVDMEIGDVVSFIVEGYGGPLTKDMFIYGTTTYAGGRLVV